MQIFSCLDDNDNSEQDVDNDNSEQENIDALKNLNKFYQRDIKLNVVEEYILFKKLIVTSC